MRKAQLWGIGVLVAVAISNLVFSLATAPERRGIMMPGAFVMALLVCTPLIQLWRAHNELEARISALEAAGKRPE